MKSFSSLVLCLVLSGCNGIPREGWPKLEEYRTGHVPSVLFILNSHGRSMLPTFSTRETLAVRPYWGETLAVGTVVVYESEVWGNVCHRVRIAEPQNGRYYIAGDALDSVRGWIRTSQIRWVVVGRVRD